MLDIDFLKVKCLGYDLYADKLNRIYPLKKALINTINQYSYCIAEKDPEFKNSLLKSDILLPDGIGIVWATRFLKKIKIKKIAGADIHQYLLEQLDNDKGSCFYMGSSPSTLEKIEKRISLEFPNIKVRTYSPPFKPHFSDKENAEIINKINHFSPDVLFVGMTAPKQEKWSYTHFDQLDTRLVCSIGAVFDFYAGTVKRPGKVWQGLGLEWMGRLLKEPKRMYKRYINYGLVFIFYLFKERLTGKKELAAD